MRTRIVATLGPASMDDAVMRELVAAGARIFRLNFSHSDAASFKPVIERIRAIEREVGLPLTVMGDLCGPKTRIGVLDAEAIDLHKGDEVCMGLSAVRNGCAPSEGMAGKAGVPFIPLDMPELLAGLAPGMPVTLADGLIRLSVLDEIEKDGLFSLEVQTGGRLTSKKGVAFPGKPHALKVLTDKDKKDIREGLAVGVDALAVSFVQSHQDVIDAKAEIAKWAGERFVPVVAKLERTNAVADLDNILIHADAVMVARGDLGLEADLAEVPILQKKIARACRHAQKPCIVATQMLLSMVEKPMPTRAEVTDVSNAMLDGCDCVMLSEETAVGKFPVEAVRLMARIAAHSEPYFLERIKGPFAPKAGERNPLKYMVYSASLIADQVEAKAILAHTESGTTARLLSSRRPEKPVYALTPDANLLRYLNFFWGVKPRLIATKIEDHLERAARYAQTCPDFQTGESVVITAGAPTPGMPKPNTNAILAYWK